MTNNQHPPMVVTDPYSGQQVNIEPLFRLMDEQSDSVCNATGIASLERMFTGVAYALNHPDTDVDDSREHLRAANFILIGVSATLREMNTYQLPTQNRPVAGQAK